MHFPVLVVDGDILVQAGSYGLVVDHHLFPARLGIDHQLKDVQELAPVSAGLAEQGLRLSYVDVSFLQNLILGDGFVEQYPEILHLQTLEDVYLASREKGSDDFERRVFRSGAYQYHGAGFDRPEKGILLRLVEAVNLVDEKYGRSILGENPAGPGGVDNFPDFLHSRADGAEGEKLPLAGIGYDSRKRGLAYARRAPQNEGTQVAALYHVAENATLADQMPLAYIIIERMRPKTFRKRRKETCHYLISFLYERRRLCWMRSNASK